VNYFVFIDVSVSVR